jgi:hypothetical protein
VDASPVLSTPVRLADQERAVDDTLDEIVAQLNESSPVKVGWGYVPLNLFNQTRIRLAADDVTGGSAPHPRTAAPPRHLAPQLRPDHQALLPELLNSA